MSWCLLPGLCPNAPPFADSLWKFGEVERYLKVSGFNLNGPQLLTRLVQCFFPEANLPDPAVHSSTMMVFRRVFFSKFRSPLTDGCCRTEASHGRTQRLFAGAGKFDCRSATHDSDEKAYGS